MARDQDKGSTHASPQRHSALLNKTRYALLMGVLGLAALIGAHLLAPGYAPLALAGLVVGVGSAFLSVGPTYSGTCPHCRRPVVYTHAYGARSFRCRACGDRIAFRKGKGGVEFLKR